MTCDLEDAGFAPPRCARAQGRRSTAVAQLIASSALVVSITVAVTAVSLGIARADGLKAVAQDNSAHAAVAILLALVFGAMGGLTAWLSRSRAPIEPRD